MVDYVRKVMNPIWYHGHGKKPPFFEGWYIKCISADENQKWAFIPGIFINKDSSKTHAFIQVLDGNSGKAYYHEFSYEQFSAEQNAFDVRIGNSHFQQTSVSFDIKDEIGSISGTLDFNNLTPWPITWTSPGVMGWYGWLPFLECYHGVSSLDHEIEGTLNIYGTEVNFTGGRGYMEKDWGQSFPTGYIWHQTNHFDTVGTSLSASIATVPNVGLQVAGFIVGFWHEKQLYKFTTYNGTKVTHVHVDDNLVDWGLINQKYEIQIKAERAEGGLLLGPEREDMHKRVDETLQSRIDVELYSVKGKSELIFKGTGRNAGLEVVGDLSKILKP